MALIYLPGRLSGGHGSSGCCFCRLEMNHGVIFHQVVSFVSLVKKRRCGLYCRYERLHGQGMGVMEVFIVLPLVFFKSGEVIVINQGLLAQASNHRQNRKENLIIEELCGRAVY